MDNEKELYVTPYTAYALLKYGDLFKTDKYYKVLDDTLYTKPYACGCTVLNAPKVVEVWKYLWSVLGFHIIVNKDNARVEYETTEGLKSIDYTSCIGKNDTETIKSIIHELFYTNVIKY